MSFVDSFFVIQRSVLEILFLIYAKNNRNILKEMSLFFFDAQNIVGIAFPDGFGDFLSRQWSRRYSLKGSAI
jgi:hypothetical protein